MAIRIVRLGSARAVNEGLRLGTVRRPPRGVPKSDFAKRNFYDVVAVDAVAQRGAGQAGAGGEGFKGLEKI